MKKIDIQSQAVIMCGISGSGKTYIAKQLEKEGYIRLSTDYLVWRKTGGDIHSLTKESRKHLFTECRMKVKEDFTSLLKSGEKIVVDATNCKRAVRDEMREICTKTGIKPVFVYCHADEDMLWRRLSERNGSGPDDLRVTYDEFKEYLKGFERPQEDECDFIFWG